MIKLYTGLPGSGKTYRVVYELREESHKYYVFHNIDGLNESAFDDGKYIQKFPKEENEFREFFTVENQKKIQEEAKEKYNRQVLIIIDECQLYLDRVYLPIKQWMSYHRHLGQDIWLITQNKFNIARDYSNLVELEIQGKKGFVFSSFIYSFIAHGERIKTDKLPKDKDVYGLYQSMFMNEVKKPKSKIFIYAAVVGLFAVGLGTYYIFFQLPDKIKEKGNPKVNETSNKQNPKPLMMMEQQNNNVLTYSYIGIMNNKAVFVDNSNNLWYQDEIYQEDTLIKNKDSRKATLIRKEKGPMELKLGSIKMNSGGAGGAGRATASAAAQPAAYAVGQEYKKIIIDVK